MDQVNLKVIGLIAIGAVFLLAFTLKKSAPTYHMQQPIPLEYMLDISDSGPKRVLPCAMFDTNVTRVRDLDTITWSPDLDVLDENVVMADALLTDTREMADVTKSIICIKNPKRVYKVGDVIKLSVRLNDGYGKPRTVGGDKMVVRIFERSIGASASGYIIDNNDGTYTAIVTCLWDGTPTIEIALDFPRQNYRTSHVFYKNKEQHPCQPTRQLLNSSKPICNMSNINGGMSWFCEAPEAKRMHCQDILIFRKNIWLNPVDTMPDKILMENNRTYFPPVVIIVRGQSMDPKSPKLKSPCSSYNRTQLWFLPSPVGHFIHNQWKIRHCRAPLSNKLPECLRNQHFVFFGDSTVYQWFENLHKRFEFNSSIRELFFAKSDEFSYSPELNFTLDFIRHSFPGNLERNISQSIAKYILSDKVTKTTVFVIHIYAHVITHHHGVWRDRIKHIRHSIEVFLQYNPDAKFLIKGGNGVHPLRLVHYAYYLYRRILIEEFKGLYDRVIYLDVADATTASGATEIHPGRSHVTGMVNQMLAYICK